MDTLVKRIDGEEGYVLEIHLDFDVQNPRELGGYLGTMICGHPDYILGDVQLDRGECLSWDHALFLHICRRLNISEEEIEDIWHKDDQNEIEDIYNSTVYYPLYLYDHSGITMSIRPFPCRWDSMRVGWIFVIKDDLEGTTVEEAFKVLENEVKEYDYFIRGEVYGFRLMKEEKCEICEQIVENDIDSCWGFLGPIEESGLMDCVYDNVGIEEKFKEVI